MLKFILIMIHVQHLIYQIISNITFTNNVPRAQIYGYIDFLSHFCSNLDFENIDKFIQAYLYTDLIILEDHLATLHLILCESRFRPRIYQ